MALLALCWLFVESFIIPDGFLKWLYLSCYINPLFLVFCQIFLWLKECLLFLFFPFTVAFRLVFRFLNSVALFLFSFSTVEVYYDAVGTHIRNNSPIGCEVVVSYSSRWNSIHRNLYQSCVATEEYDQTSCVEDSWLNKYLYSDHYSSSMYDVDVFDGTASFRFSFTDQSLHSESHESINRESEDSENSTCDSQLLENMVIMSSQEGSVSPVSTFDFNDSLSTTDDCLSAANMLVDRAPDSPFRAQQLSIQEDIDPFHQKYASRMRFFNVLYHERLHGMNAIQDEHLTTPGFLNCAEPATDLPMQFMLWSRMARKRILRSLECDLEMIYVAQSCLFWEALNHQYHKVEALTFSDHSENVEFHHSVPIKFQELQILLERFVEGQGSSSNTQKRLSFQGLLQVPDTTGYIFEEEEKKSMREEGIRATQVLEAINDCIEAFWLYIKTDNKKLSWKYETIWRTHPPVEDPQDLELLYDVTKTLHKKGMMVKDVQGKSKCWLRRKVKTMQTEDEKRSLLFAMIDMKLVQRLLKMSLVSSSHLKWCQEKLNSLDFKEGRVFRSHISHLFPTS